MKPTPGRYRPSRLAFLVAALVCVCAAAVPLRFLVDPTARYRAAPAYAIPLEQSDPALGAPDAPARLVVFCHFASEACRSLSQVLTRLRQRFGDDLGLVFKNVLPLDACAAALPLETRPGACAAACAAEAANLQGRFWPYQRALFDGWPTLSEERLLASARAAGVRVEQWETDRRSTTVRAKIEADVELGVQLGIAGTPAVFLNGRRVENPSLAVLTMLAAREIAERRRTGAPR